MNTPALSSRKQRCGASTHLTCGTAPPLTQVLFQGWVQQGADRGLLRSPQQGEGLTIHQLSCSTQAPVSK